MPLAKEGGECGMVQFGMTATAGSPEANPLETAVMLDSFKGVLMWTFFIVLAIVIGLIVLYIKEKNAQANKHS